MGATRPQDTERPSRLCRSEWPREESNLRTQVRSLPLYPLSYGAVAATEGNAQPDTGAMALVVVDAENTRRSQWPNLSREELVRRARVWAEREGHELLVVFDGSPPEQARDVIGSRNADDAIVELAPQLAAPWWLVTSDRGLRGRVGDRPERVIGGGSFVRTI